MWSFLKEQAEQHGVLDKIESAARDWGSERSEALQPGAKVVLHSLSAVDLNGQECKCVSYDAGRSRWTVQLTDGSLP